MPEGPAVWALGTQVRCRARESANLPNRMVKIDTLWPLRKQKPLNQFVQ